MPLLTTQSARSYGFGLQSELFHSYQGLASYTVGVGGVDNISFTIPSTYDHLQFFYRIRTTKNATTDFVNVRFNSDNTSNYNFDYLEAASSTSTLNPGVGTKATNTAGWLTAVVGGNATANIFAQGQGFIADYSKTNRNKTMHCLGGYDDHGTSIGNSRIENTVWFSNNAITTINFYPESLTKFAQYSNISIFGIKG